MRTLRLLAVLPVAAAAVVLGTAAPGSAAGARNVTYAASWEFHGTGVTQTASALQLTDYAGTQYFDRVTGTPTRTESIVIGGQACTPGSSHQSGLSLYGDSTTWANMAVSTDPADAAGASVVVHCTYGGQVHRLSWGTFTANNGAFYGATKCVSLSRPTQTTFTLSASGTCTAEDVTLNTKVQVIARHPGPRDLPFTATITVPGLG